MMELVQLTLASVAFASGGLFMKLSEGMSRPGPVVGFYACFAAGATLQALGMRHADFSVSYIFVLGLEAVVTLGLSVWYLHESCPPSRLAAVVVVVAGIIWLRHS